MSRKALWLALMIPSTPIFGIWLATEWYVKKFTQWKEYLNQLDEQDRIKRNMPPDKL